MLLLNSVVLVKPGDPHGQPRCKLGMYICVNYLKCSVVSLPQGQEVAAVVAPPAVLVEVYCDVSLGLVAPQASAVDAEESGGLYDSVGAVGRDVGGGGCHACCGSLRCL